MDGEGEYTYIPIFRSNKLQRILVEYERGNYTVLKDIKDFRYAGETEEAHALQTYIFEYIGSELPFESPFAYLQCEKEALNPVSKECKKSFEIAVKVEQDEILRELGGYDYTRCLNLLGDRDIKKKCPKKKKEVIKRKFLKIMENIFIFYELSDSFDKEIVKTRHRELINMLKKGIKKKIRFRNYLRYFMPGRLYSSRDGKKLLINRYIWYDIDSKTFYYTGVRYRYNPKLLSSDGPRWEMAYDTVGFLNNNTILLITLKGQQNKDFKKLIIYKHRLSVEESAPKVYKILYFKGNVNKPILSPNGRFLAIVETFEYRNPMLCPRDNRAFSFETLWIVDLKTKRRFPITLHPSMVEAYYNSLKKVGIDLSNKCIDLNDIICKVGHCFGMVEEKSPYAKRVENIIWSPDSRYVVFNKITRNDKKRVVIYGIKEKDIGPFFWWDPLLHYLSGKCRLKLYVKPKELLCRSVNCAISDIVETSYELKEDGSTDHTICKYPEFSYILDENFEPLFWYSNKKVAFRYKNKFIMLFDLKSLSDTAE